MADRIRNRTIRTETRGSESDPYKVDTKKITKEDTLIVNIDHISKEDFFESYTFRGSDVANKNSISFKAIDWGKRIEITWSGAQPVGLPVRDKSKAKTGKTKDWLDWDFTYSDDTGQSENFVEIPPAADDNCKVLILGPLPDLTNRDNPKYYPEETDLFWNIFSELYGEKFPKDYEERIKFLVDQNIGLWHVCKIKIDDQDKPIDNEDIVANNLENFVDEHKELKCIAFNGKETSKLFAKYFRSFRGIKLQVLQSSNKTTNDSPLEEKVKDWKKIVEFIDEKEKT